MSRNSKNARLHREAKSFKRAELKGDTHVSTGRKGPAQTTPKHGKKNAWFQHYDTYGEFLKSSKGRKHQSSEE